jgi:hypothetical protein
MQFGRGKPSAGAFFDSDFSTMDSVLAQALLHGLQGKNDCRVAIVTMSRPNLAVTGFTDAVERYYRGRAGNFAQVPPIGMRTAGQPGTTSPAFTEPFAMKKADGTPLAENYVARVIDTGDPNTLLRNYLEAQYDLNGFFVLAGPATNLAAALEFRGMKDLIAAKTNYLVAACNVQADVASARKVLGEWPTPIYWVGAEVGDAMPFPGASIDKEFTAANPDNPLIAAYKAYKPMVYDTPAPAMVAALYAARPKEGYFKVSDSGTITVGNDGRVAFAASAQGKHHSLTVDPEKKDAVIQTWVELASAKPVFPQRFRPPAAADKAGKKGEDKPEAPEQALPAKATEKKEP